MSDSDRHDEEIADNGEPEAPPPKTWAGRARSGDDEPAEQEAESGLTDEFEGLEAELSADLGELGTDEQEAEPDLEEEPEPGEEPDPADEPEPDAADELEQPPDEFEFDQEGDADAEPEAEETTARSQETVEADTLSVADVEAKQEAAHAGLRARAEKSAAERVGITAAQASVAGAVAAAPSTGAGEPPRRNVWWRFLAASFVIVGSVASATSIAFLLYLTDVGEALDPDSRFEEQLKPSLSEVEGGEPQTILILGSDKRTTAPGDPGRSDTTMLLRVDPEKDFLALMSLPRDLKVEIPGYGTDKLNAAYSYGEQFDQDRGGGPQLTLRTVKELLGIDINHIVNVDFEGFYDAVNAIGCVYVDVDRHYYNPQGGEYDDIDIEAGYTRLCGYRALDYVRYRHNDNDLVRGARQQAFVREARQQIPPRSLLPPPFGDAELIDIFTKYTTSDINDAPTIVDMLKSFVDVRSAPVRQVSLGELTVEGGVGASGEDVKVAVDQFLGNDIDAAPEEATEPAEPKRKPKRKGKERDKPDEGGPALIDATGTAQELATDFSGFLERRGARLPVFYPTAVIASTAAGVSPESRAHIVDPPNGVKKPYWGYKFVLPYQEGFGLSYYGVTGVNWTDPPILRNPSETRRIDGRDYMLFYEKDRLRLVGWTTKSGAYWVINTLTRALSEDEMIAVATSTREFEG